MSFGCVSNVTNSICVSFFSRWVCFCETNRINMQFSYLDAQ